MRTRAGWIALVLTGGLVLTPATLRAQPGELNVPGREAAPVLPLPIYNRFPEGGGLFAAIEFAMYRMTRDFGNQTLAYRGLVDVDGSIQRDFGGQFVILAPGGTPVFVAGPQGPPGAYFGSGVPALNTGQLNSQWTYQPGFRTTLGWRFSDASTFEARWLHVQAARYNAGADIIPPGFVIDPQMANTFLFSPVFGFPVNFIGPARDLGVGNDNAAYGIWNAADQMSIEMLQRYDQADFMGKVEVRKDPISRTYVVAGGRFAWIWERFQWRTVDRDGAGAAQPSDVAIYSNVVSNRMYGPTLGCQHDVYLGSFGRVGAFSLGLQVDAAAMIDVVKEYAKYELGDRSASSKKSVREYTFSPMLNGEIQLTWYPAAGIQVRMSWNSMAFFNTVNATNPVSFNFANISTTDDFGPEPNAPGTRLPIWERKTIRYLDGIQFGFGLSF